MEAVYTPAGARQLFDPPRRAYILFGEDDRQKDEALAALRASALDESFADFDLEQLDADSAGTDRILSAAGMAPFASRVRLVIVRRAEVYRKREMSGEAERLAAGIATLGDASCLVLRAGAGEDEGSRGKTALHPKLDSAIKGVGAVIRFKSLNEDQLADWVAAEAKIAGVSIDPDAARLLVEMAGDSRTVLKNELEKAICFAGDSAAVSAEMVESILTHDPEDVTFKLVDAVSQRNSARAFHLFAELLRYDSKPHAIAGRLLALLARQYSLLWQARELSARRVRPQDLKTLPPEIAELLPSEGGIGSLSWKAGDLFRMSNAWSRESLARAMELLVECDVNNKGGGEGSEDVRRNLEILLINLCALK